MRGRFGQEQHSEVEVRRSGRVWSVCIGLWRMMGVVRGVRH